MPSIKDDFTTVKGWATSHVLLMLAIVFVIGLIVGEVVK